MPAGAQQKLRRFYQQAALTPELLCLCCSETAWRGGNLECSAERRANCALFAGYMSQELNDSARVFQQTSRNPGRISA